MYHRSKLAAAMALVALATPQLAAAQKSKPANCVTEREVSDLLVYLVPAALDGVQEKCSGELAANGYLTREGEGLRNRYLSLAHESWPGARSAFMKIGTERPERGALANQVLSDIPDEYLREIVDVVMVAELFKSMELDTCRDTERLVERLAPLEPREFGDLMAAVLSVAEAERPSICQAKD